MDAFLIEVDPVSPEPPFKIEAVFIAKGLTEFPKDNAEGKRLIICLVGSADVTVQAENLETFHLTGPNEGLFVEIGARVLSVGGPLNMSTVILSSA